MAHIKNVGSNCSFDWDVLRKELSSTAGDNSVLSNLYKKSKKRFQKTQN